MSSKPTPRLPSCATCSASFLMHFLVSGSGGGANWLSKVTVLLELASGRDDCSAPATSSRLSSASFCTSISSSVELNPLLPASCEGRGGGGGGRDVGLDGRVERTPPPSCCSCFSTLDALSLAFCFSRLLLVLRLPTVGKNGPANGPMTAPLRKNESRESTGWSSGSTAGSNMVWCRTLRTRTTTTTTMKFLL